MASISIVIPVYNEEKAVKNTVERAKKVAAKLKQHKVEVLIVNDGSKDKTAQILNKIGGIKVINRPYNCGYGASLKVGLREAMGDWIVITDADGTYPIEDIPRLVKLVPEYDMVVGARVGKTVHIPFFRRPAKWVVGKLANMMVKRKIEDINSGLRIFNKKKALEFMKLYPPGFSFTTTITLAFFTNDYTVKYIPINYFKRKGSSIMGDVPSPKAIKTFFNFIGIIFRIILYFRPLKFFAWPGSLLILAGIIYGYYQTVTSVAGLGDLPVLLLILGTLVIFLGVIADSIAKK
ncbi:hypothetical protein COV18_02050 [Candidatus Woesearchaeota archaeon CG10_big_fil_rev_8_21_14_0_10_37_12]|nr:MAG: hypothetical protein COV18_02050 [Candidatus Woesearchaeota archaeon CG10_big_fil_rev_8_21_14_0_10_37_12]